MKKIIYGYAQENLNNEIQWYLKAFNRYTSDLARANRIEAETATMTKNCYKALSDFMGFDANSVVNELRDDKHIQQSLRSIARNWQHARISKSQRALLGNDAMAQIKSIYKTL